MGLRNSVSAIDAASRRKVWGAAIFLVIAGEFTHLLVAMAGHRLGVREGRKIKALEDQEVGVV